MDEVSDDPDRPWYGMKQRALAAIAKATGNDD